MTAGNIFLLLEFYINNETVEKIGHRKTSGWLSQSSSSLTEQWTRFFLEMIPQLCSIG